MSSITEHTTTHRDALRASIAKMAATWRAGADGAAWPSLPHVLVEHLQTPSWARLREAAEIELRRSAEAGVALPDALRLLKACRARIFDTVHPAQADAERLVHAFDDLELALVEACAEARWPLPPRYQRLEAVGRVAAGLAHEVNTPVQALASNVDFLGDAVQVLVELAQAHRFGIEALAEDGGEEGDAWLEQVEREEEAADLEFLVDELPDALRQSAAGLAHVSEMIHGLKAFAHGAGEVATDVDALTRFTTALLVPSFDSSIELRFELCGDAPRVVCDPRALRQVVYDLVDNAGLSIEQALGPRPDRLGHICVRTRATERHVIVEVEDDGDGVPRSFLGHLFDPGFSTWSREGLGLTYARDFAERLGGDLRLTDGPRGGAIARLALPR